MVLLSLFIVLPRIVDLPSGKVSLLFIKPPLSRFPLSNIPIFSFFPPIPEKLFLILDEIDLRIWAILLPSEEILFVDLDISPTSIFFLEGRIFLKKFFIGENIPPICLGNNLNNANPAAIATPNAIK